MPYRRPRFFASLALLTGIGLCAGCSAFGGGSATASPGKVEKPDITVDVVPTTDSTGFYIALHDGLFAKQGLHVTYQVAISGERVINDQALGKVDISAGNYVSYIEAQLNYDRGVRANPNIAEPNASQIAANMDIFAEASIMQPGFVGLFTRPGSPITKPSDLVGKTIGLNAPGNVAYLLTASYLADNGINPHKVKYVYYPFPVMEKALMAHKMDVAFLAAPFITYAEQTAGVNELTNLDEGANTAFPIEGYAVTKQWAAKYPKTLAAFKRALEQGQEIADTNRPEAEKAMEAFSKTDGVSPIIGAVTTFQNYPLGAVDATRLQRVSDEMRQFGLTPKALDVHEVIGSGG